MAKISQIANSIEEVFDKKFIDNLARSQGFIQREVVVTGSGFVKTLVTSFQANKAASYSEMSACASSLGMPITSQGIEQRFTKVSALFMRSVLEHALAIRVKGVDEQNVPLLNRFKAVHIRDSSIISLPLALKDEWRGLGGNRGENSAMKLQVSWEQCSGNLDGITLQDGRCQDQSSPYQDMEMESGALHIADLGYYSLEKLFSDGQKGVFWLSRLKYKTLLWDKEGKAIDLLKFLTCQRQDRLDIPVYVGARRKIHCRLLAGRVPTAVANQRKRHIKEQYRIKCLTPADELLKLTEWTLVITNVPASMLTFKEAFTLLKIRWQIELLFKLWKSHISIDQWTSQNPWRVLAEIYTKILIAVLFHWTMLADFWSFPDRSMVKAYKIFQHYSFSILSALEDKNSLMKILNNLSAVYIKSCRISKHPNYACTFQVLLNPDMVLC